MVGFTLSLFGSFQATLDGVPVASFDSDRVRALLAYLAVETDRPHRRDILTGLVWPNWPDSSALTNLRNSLANLRKAIGDRDAANPVLSVQREALQFNLTAGAWVDVQAFRDLTAPDQPITRQEEGIALYRGEFLEGFGLKDSPAYDAWQQRVRDQLHRQCFAALERVSVHYEGVGNLSKALEITQKQVGLAPWQEEPHQRLMRLLALAGQRSAALAQYETCRHFLKKELGVEVSPATTVLYQRILNRQIASPDEIQDPIQASTPLFNAPDLPTWQIPFVERQALTEEINACLLDPACRLLTLLGPGGSGKTRLAAETASRMAGAFPDGVFFAQLAGLQPGAAILPAMAQVLGLQFSDKEDPKSQVQQFLRNKALLLVLDNFEHLLAQAAPVAEILRYAPRVKMLVTSQVRLDLSGEHLVQVFGMEVPKQPPASLAEALRHGSLQLFLEGARRVVPGFAPTPTDLEQILRICRLVQGTPLAILLAAGWMYLLSPVEIADEIDLHRLDFLESKWQDVPERQRSLRAVFDYSWRLLSVPERQVFAGLAVFQGDFNYPAAQQACGATLRDLMMLVNHSLLERTSAGRYRLHEMVRQYGTEKLAESADQGQDVRDRHAAYFTAALKNWAVRLKSSSQVPALAEMDLEIDNIRAAWQSAVEHRQMERLAKGWEGLAIFYFWRGHLAEGGLAFQRATELFDDAEPALQPQWLGLWAVCMAFQCLFARPLNPARFNKDWLSLSRQLLERAATSGQDIRRHRAHVLWIMGQPDMFYFEGVSERQELNSSSLAVFQEIGDLWGEARVWATLAEIAQFVGDYAEAVRCFQHSLAIRQRLGVQMEVFESQRDLAFVLSLMGRLEEAEQLVKECIDFYRRHGDPLGLAKGLYVLITDLIFLGRYSEIPEWIAECTAIYEKLGNQTNLARILMRQGLVQLGLGDYPQARIALERSYSLYQEPGVGWGTGQVKWHLGDLALAQGQWMEAYAALQESVDRLRRAGAHGIVNLPLASLGMAELKLNDAGHTRQRLAEVISHAMAFHDFLTPVTALPCSIMLLAETGKEEWAVELQALASRFPYFTNSVFIQDQIASTLSALTRSLPPEVTAAAWQRGQQRDLWTTMAELLAEFRDD